MQQIVLKITNKNTPSANKRTTTL